MAVNIGPKIGIDGESEYRKQIQGIIQQQKTLASEMKAVTAGFDSNTSAQKKAKAQAEVLTKQVKTQTQRVDALKDMLEKSKKEFGENDTRTQKWQQAVNEANAELKQMQKELKEATTQSSIFRTALNKAGTGMKDLTVKGVKKLGSSLSSGFKSTVKGAVTAIGSLTLAAGAAVVALGKMGLDYNMEMETYTTNFQTMLGSATKAQAKVESLKQMAASTPFEMTDLANATQQLLAMGVASEDTNKYLQQLGDISLGNVDKLNSLIGAFGKMNSSGKVTLEYINIMAEQGFNPLNLIAQKTGETMTEVYARVSAGTVTFDEVKNAIAAATSAGGQFYKGMEKASQTTAGRIATLKDNATALVGEVFEPISEGLSGKLLPAAIDAVDELSAAFRENGVNGMVAAAGDIVGETIAGFALSLPDFVNTAVSIVDSLMQGIKDNLVTISNGASTAVLTLADGIIDLLPELIVTGTLLIGKLAAGVIKGLPDLVAQIPSMIEEIVSGFAKHGGEWKQIGLDIVNGIWDSLKIYWKNFTDWFDGAWEDLVSGVKDLLGIHSPSRVFGNIGKNMALGAEDGWFNTFGGIKKDIQNSMNFDAGFVTMRPSMAPAMATVGGGSAVSYGGFTFNIYAQPGQDADAIADAVMDRIQTEVERKGAAW